MNANYFYNLIKLLRIFQSIILFAFLSCSDPLPSVETVNPRRVLPPALFVSVATPPAPKPSLALTSTAPISTTPPLNLNNISGFKGYPVCSESFSKKFKELENFREMAPSRPNNAIDELETDYKHHKE